VVLGVGAHSEKICSIPFLKWYGAGGLSLCARTGVYDAGAEIGCLVCASNGAKSACELVHACVAMEASYEPCFAQTQ
jgi:hypothetical protein